MITFNTKEEFNLVSTYSKTFELTDNKHYKVYLEMDCYRGALEYEVSSDFTDYNGVTYAKSTNSVNPSILFTYRMAITSDMNKSVNELSKQLKEVGFSDMYIENDRDSFTFQEFIDRMHLFIINNPKRFISKYLV